jgi:ABC-type multidrug transport system fused ATPase/permease subunit
MNSSLRALRRLLEGSGRLVAASLALSLAQSALLVPIAFLIRHAFDETIPSGDSEDLIWIGAGVLALYLAGSAIGLLTRWLTLRATKEAVMRLQEQVIAKLYYLPKSFFDSRDAGALHATVVQDSLRVDTMANAIVAILIPAAVVGFFLIATLCVISPVLGAVVCVAGPVLVVAGKRLGPYVRRHTARWNAAFDEFSSQTQTALRSMTLTKLEGAERSQLERRRAELEAVKETGRTMAFWQSAYALIQTLVSAAIGLIVLVAGGAAVADGKLSLGDLISFYAVLGLLRTQLSGSLFAIPQVISGRESLERLTELVDLEEVDPYGGNRELAFAGGIELRGVSFAYEPSHPILREFDLEVQPGESVLLVGPNGIGKSTILSLIVGLYKPHEGTVLADGHPLGELDLPSLRRGIGVVSQDPVILPGTVWENLTFGQPGAPSSAVELAVAQAGADGFIAELPEGYDSRVGDEGELLSGGQRQRLAIARALLGRPAMLMLDEPTTHLDHEGVRGLLRALSDADPRLSVIVVSHDPQVAAGMDRVVDLGERFSSVP